jgi:hypothetical protein
MNHYCYTWVKDWCNENGWTDLFVQERHEYWAFPPNAVMPLPIPAHVLSVIKEQHGLSLDEKRWNLAAFFAAGVALIASYWFQSPMPLVIAFAFCAIAVAQLEIED